MMVMPVTAMIMLIIDMPVMMMIAIIMLLLVERHRRSISGPGRYLLNHWNASICNHNVYLNGH